MRKLEKADFNHIVKLSYDPDDVNIRLQHFRVGEILLMIEDKFILKEDFSFLDDYKNTQVEDDEEAMELEGDDGLQRNSGLWSATQKSRLIESLMIRLPVPLFYFDGSRKPWRVIDGLQRLSSIVSFFRDDYKLTGLEYLADECENRHAATIPGYLRNRILDAEIIAYVINPGTPPDVKYNIFKRINTGGLKLNGQEIRNAFFHGEPANLLKRLAESQPFLTATNFKVTNRRMTDREYVNRFVAFQVFDFEAYNGKMDIFLSEALIDLFHRSEQERFDLEQIFFKCMDRCHELFGNYAFYRFKVDGTPGRQPNKAIFDTLTWNIAELTDYEFDRLMNSQDEFKRNYYKLIDQHQPMYNSINDTTGTRGAVFTRFTELRGLIEYIIQ